ncbi:M23 family metallopeptidase [Xanthocytophaga agilis]|uniref:M23 family metallopeptidase n=1 Tax=Xanthocytophaga agilis TaxID=3048010 RepID=A0AAE3UI06_9BACT|nr:M23 family metallopeptidase [Xanthocytophaga agilis]MDJ1504856.1 M23 family metallopeptidase [Xanthocytophaga agilis]
MQTTNVKKISRPRYKRWILGFFCFVMLIGYCIPEKLRIPVQKASDKDWNHQSFWHYPWGKSGVHKGIDIFAPKGRNVVASTGGLVIWKGTMGIGGKAVIVIGPKWHCHYYAHLQDYHTHWGHGYLRVRLSGLWVHLGMQQGSLLICIILYLR